MHTSIPIQYDALKAKHLFGKKDRDLIGWTKILPAYIRKPLLPIAVFVTILGLVGGMLLCIAAYLLVSLGIGVAASLALHIDPIVGGSVSFLLVTFFGGRWLYSRQKTSRHRRDSAIQQFARQNGWTFGPSGPLLAAADAYYATLATEHPHTTLYTVKGAYGGYDFELLLSWEGKGEKEIEAVSPALFVSTHRDLPSAALIPRKAGSYTQSTDKLFIRFDNPVRVSLEGDFDQYFQLYTPDKKHIDALALIAPDMMQAVMGAADAVAIEMSGRTLIIDSYGQIPGYDSIRRLFESASQVIDQIEK